MKFASADMFATPTVPQTVTPATFPLSNVYVQDVRALTTENIQSYGADEAQASSKLATQVLEKVKMSNSGEFGVGINNILGLMGSVDIKTLGENKPSLFSKAKSFITRTKADFMDNFTDVSTKVEGVASILKDGVTRMQGEAKWLQQMYDENLKMLDTLRLKAEAVQLVFEEADKELSVLQSDPSADPLFLNTKKIYVDRLSKQADKLLRLTQLARLTAPEIRSMQVSNYNNSEKFKDLVDVTIPAWKKQISFGLISLRQKQDAELATQIDDASNQFMQTAADLIHDNIIHTAQNSQRSVIDLATLQHIQNSTIDAIKQVKAIDEKGRQDRKDAILAIGQMETQLRDEAKTW